MFEKKYSIVKSQFETTYGSVCIQHVEFSPGIIQKNLLTILFDEKNLKYMFDEKELDMLKTINILNRFIPENSDDLTIDDIKKLIRDHKTFYSFLAEGMLGLVFRDIYSFSLSKGLIDICETVNDTHSGADACMYDDDRNIIVLGEAKFYESMDDGMDEIIDNFINDNISNKIESFKRKACCSDDSYKIILKNLNKSGFVRELSLQEFLNQNLYFVGFVLHSEDNIEKYEETSYYEKFEISTDKIKKNIEKCCDVDEITSEYNIILFHLPIESKKELILDVINKAKEKLNKLGE